MVKWVWVRVEVHWGTWTCNVLIPDTLFNLDMPIISDGCRPLANHLFPSRTLDVHSRNRSQEPQSSNQILFLSVSESLEKHEYEIMKHILLVNVGYIYPMIYPLKVVYIPMIFLLYSRDIPVLATVTCQLASNPDKKHNYTYLGYYTRWPAITSWFVNSLKDIVIIIPLWLLQLLEL